MPNKLPTILEHDLRRMYEIENRSMMEIATELGCSQHKVAYWMTKYGIRRRSWSDASYVKHNPTGDPFNVKPIETIEEAILFGIGIGLYWGEGTKASRSSVRLGNTDPGSLRSFMRFLEDLFGADRKTFKFGLQIFTDIDPMQALDYWVKELGVEKRQFQKPVVTVSGSIGSYRTKSRFGVVTLHYNNSKVRRMIGELLVG